MSVLQRFCASINEEIMQEGSPSTISKQSQLLLLIHSASSKATHLWCHTWKFYVRTEELPSCRPYVLPGLAAIVNCLHEKAWVNDHGCWSLTGMMNLKCGYLISLFFWTAVKYETEVWTANKCVSEFKSTLHVMAPRWDWTFGSWKNL